MAIISTKGSLSFKVLPKEIRKRFNGEMSYQALDTGDKWIYKKHQVTHTNADIFTTGDDFLGVTSSAALALTDKVRFLMIKHTGYGDADETKKVVHGILINPSGGVPAFGARVSQHTCLYLLPGESMVLKHSATLASDYHAITCRVTGGVPTADGVSGDTAILEIAAIIDDL